MAGRLNRQAGCRVFCFSCRKGPAFFGCNKHLIFLGFLFGSLAVILSSGFLRQKQFCNYINLDIICMHESSSPLKYQQQQQPVRVGLESHEKHDAVVDDNNNIIYAEPGWNSSFHQKIIQLIPDLKDKYRSYLQPVSTIFSNTSKVSHETKKLLEHVVRSGYGLKPYKTDRGEAGWIENGIIYRPSRRINPVGFTAEYEPYVPFDKHMFFEGRKPDPRSKTEKKIILWYPKPLYIRKMQDPEPLIACPQFPCLETTNTEYLANSSAVIVTDVFINKALKPPERSSPKQVMVIHNHESPHFLGTIAKADPSWRSIFNWTFSFRMDSDIVRPYAIIRRRPKKPSQKDYRAVLALKTGLVFWAVSNCHTNSKREDYVKKLRKYITVDQMGKCGGLTCRKAHRENCTEMFASKYKFYLAFENNMCRDYITEKIFNYLHKDMVIVAHASDDYYRHLPSETFINVNDYPSPKLLADRLWYLHRNEEEYLNILRAKDQYIIMLEDHIVRFSPKSTTHNDFVFLAAPRCLLCQRLWNLERHKKTIPDIIKWFEKGKCTSKIVYTYSKV